MLYIFGLSPIFKPPYIGTELNDYLRRVQLDSGVVANPSMVDQWIHTAKANGFFDPTQMLIAPIFGYKERISAPYSFLSKLYSLRLAANDAAQTTASNQPYKAGNIAQNEVLAAKNPNGDARFFTHPTISFAANEAWSVSVMVNWNANNSLYDRFIGNGAAQKSAIGLYNAGSFRGMFISENAVNGVNWNVGTTLPIIGKNAYLNFIAHGDGFISMYINGVLVEKKNSGVDTTAMIFSRLLKGTNLAIEQYTGTLHYYRIQSGAMTAGQITAEYDLLRSWIPEIESVTIGSQTWTTSNLDVVATPLGNVIPEVQPAGAVEKIVNGNFEWAKVNSDDAGMVSTIVADGTLGSNVLELVQAGAGTGGVGNRTVWNAPTGLTETLANSNGKWIKVSFKAISISGNTALAVTNTAGVGLTRSITTSWITYTGYYKQGDGGVSVMAYLTGGAGTFRIDDLKFEVLNWSNATEIYQAVYDATSGTAAQKHYAAVKEAAMWCSYDNSTANQSIYGKILNGYAIKLLNLDMITANYGYKPPLQSDWTALETYLGVDAGNDVKHNGTTYWSAPNGGTNSSGLTILPGGYRNAQGAFVGLNDEVYMITADETDDRIGGYARLIKD